MKPLNRAVLLAAMAVFPWLAKGDTLYIARYQLPAIDQVDAWGNVTQFATGFPSPTAMALDSSGNLFVATQGDQIYKITSLGDVSLFASSGLSLPDALAFDAYGNLFVANEGEQHHREI